MAFVPWGMQCFIIFDLTKLSFSSVSCMYKKNIINISCPLNLNEQNLVCIIGLRQ